MNDDQRFPHDPTGADPSDADNQEHADDQALGAALSDAIGRRVDDPVSAAPPTSVIARRAAARARARAARRTVVGIAASLALFAGGLTAWQAYDNQGGEEIMVTAPAPTEDPSTPPAPDAVSPTVPGAGGSAGSASSGSAAVQAPNAPLTPEEASTGPVLQWTEIDPPPALASNIVNAYDGIKSVGDGRILARTWDEDGYAQFFVTTDGATWTPVPTPTGISPEHIDISGSRWLVTGWPTDSFDGFTRIFFSDNQGAAWTELATDHLIGATGTSGTARLIPDSADITQVLTSGRNLVIVLQQIVFDEQAVAAIDGEAPAPPVWILASDGGRLELVADYTGWVSTGFSTNGGFTLYLVEDMEQYTLTSANGRQWSKMPSEAAWITDVVQGFGGGIWTARPIGIGSQILRLSQGAAPVTVATIDNIEIYNGLAAGPSGLAATGNVTATSAEGGVTPAGLPSGRITKDGYELRYNEPEGGITLWDVEADAAVYVFGPEVIQGETPPEGVRAPYQGVEMSSDMDVEVLVFLDPETGEDLVAFTARDILSITMTAMNDDTSFIEDLRPEMWVGWSANGTNWGWQTLPTAFEIAGDDQTWVEFAVGNGFVLARVSSLTWEDTGAPDLFAGQPPAEEVTLATVSPTLPPGTSSEKSPLPPPVTPPPSSLSTVTPAQPAPFTGQTSFTDEYYATGMSLNPQPARWFIARVP